jgi:sodium transport system ATP-binding protein
MIVARELRKCFGRTVAVDSIGFTAEDGTITTLLGGNGSGKTTTLRMIVGALEPDRGGVAIDGIDVRRERVKALSRLGVLHDDFGLYPRLEVHEQVRFGGALHGLEGAHLDDAVERALAAVGIGHLEARLAAGLSHGERMKVALARAIVHSPRNLLLDEPTRGLDVFSVRALRELLKRLRDAGTCILMSNHALAEVLELSDRIVVIDRGTVLAEDAPGGLIATAGATDLESAFVALVRDSAQRRIAS